MQPRNCVVAAALVLAIACGGTSSASLSSTESNASTSSQGQGYTISNNTPGALKKATDTGAVDPSAVISITAWLKLQNETQLDQLLAQQTTKGNANYHKWLTQADIDAQFSPTAQQANAVANWLAAKNLAVVEVAANNWYVKAQGTVGDIEKAFHVQIDNFTVSGTTFRSNTANPQIVNGPGNIDAITGLDDIGYRPNVALAQGADGSAGGFAPLNSANGTFTSGSCFKSGTETHTFTSATHTATYSGNRYTLCGFNPAEVRAAYGLNAVYSAGYRGEGETIVITDAYGSGTIQNDAAAFSYYMNLPPVDLTIVGGQGLDQNPHNGWADEVTLDVEWAHAIAPAAKIVLVVATDRSSLDEAVNRAVVHHYGNTITNSWSIPEGYGNPAAQLSMNRILKAAAAQGVDVNFSSGDYGDNRYEFAQIVTVDFPGSSPYATSIGGTSLVLNADNSVKFETGWGTNLTRISDAQPTYAPVVPPNNSRASGYGFQFGSGGGTSGNYARPSWQSGLSGTMRQVPDISAIGDPYTGVEIIETIGGQLSVGTIGGTSLSSPVFSGIMALAAQKAGHGLGQAAPLVYGLSSGVRDILPVAYGTNVSGTIDGAPESAAALAAPLFDTTVFTSGFYQGASTRWYVITFNTDTGLTTGAGWDNVTGVGVPDGLNFVTAVTQ